MVLVICIDGILVLFWMDNLLAFLFWVFGGILIFCTLVEGYELCELMLIDRLRGAKLPRESDEPFVSFHVPICSEPPEVVARTLRALGAINYSAFEVLVVDNNTADELLWRPVEALCRELGSRFRFFHLSSCPGFKAGALNYALQQTTSEASVVSVVDADYEVAPNFLTELMGYFQDNGIAFVQTPQDYRDWSANLFSRICYWEYWQVFAVSMALRDRQNALLMHGTMNLIRKDAIVCAGGWAEWCLTEDSELGLRLLANGARGIYVTKTYGRGLMPFTFRDYKRQRRRWVIGGVQQIKRHARFFRPLQRGLNSLTAGQKAHYLRWWLRWVCDATIVASLPLSICGAILVLGGFSYIKLFWPLSVGLLSVLTQLILRAIVVYRLYLALPWRSALGAMLANCSLIWTIGCAWLAGSIMAHQVFQRTPKRPHAEPSWILVARGETLASIAPFLFGIALFAKLGLSALAASLSLSVYFVFFLPGLIMARLSAGERRR